MSKATPLLGGETQDRVSEGEQTGKRTRLLWNTLALSLTAASDPLRWQVTTQYTAELHWDQLHNGAESPHFTACQRLLL